MFILHDAHRKMEEIVDDSVIVSITINFIILFFFNQILTIKFRILLNCDKTNIILEYTI